MLGTDKAELTAKQSTRPSRDGTAEAGSATNDTATEKADEIGAVSLGQRVKTVAPPLKPFRKRSRMANPPSPSYRPEIPRKVVDIPNPSRLRAERIESAATDDSKRLVVGQPISVSGDISACETLVVQGKVEASLSDAETIEVAEGGLFKGTAEVDYAIISGTFDGTLKARRS